MSRQPSFSFTPLGGSGQIGANSYLFEFQNGENKKRFLIDCGILFPKESYLGLNYLICDYSDLYDNPPDFLIITHMHEDHIGALPHLIKFFPKIPVYCTEMVAEFIRRKFMLMDLNITTIRNESLIEAEIFTLKFHQMEHSTPQTMGLEISVGDDLIYFISDFRFSIPLPLTFKESARRFLFCDSTNIEVTKHASSEATLPPHFDSLFRSINGRIFITLFSSNIERLATIIKSALEHERDIILCGRSLVTNYGIGLAHNMIPFTDRVYHHKDYPNPDSEKQVILVSGCQGDLKSALRRISTNEDAVYKLRESDTFIFSSKIIPGNERDVIGVMNNLAKENCKIITAYDHPTHASGHASKEELSAFYKVFRPTHLIPIHGEHIHLRAHIAFAKSKNIESYFIPNGRALSVDGEKIELVELVPKENIFIHGDANKEIDRPALSKRRKMAEHGVIVVTLVFGTHETKIDVEFLGLPESAESVKKIISHTISQELVKVESITEKWLEEIRILIRKKYSALYGQKPVTLVKVFYAHK